MRSGAFSKRTDVHLWTVIKISASGEVVCPLAQKWCPVSVSNFNQSYRNRFSSQVLSLPVKTVICQNLVKLGIEAWSFQRCCWFFSTNLQQSAFLRNRQELLWQINFKLLHWNKRILWSLWNTQHSTGFNSCPDYLVYQWNLGVMLLVLFLATTTIFTY